MRALYLIRHGEPDFGQAGPVCLGRLDLPLSPGGLEQARQTGAYFQDLMPLCTAASPLTRCRQTAAFIVAEAVICPALTEVDMGLWTGLPFSEIRRRWPELYARRGGDMLYTAPPEGETLAQCGERALAALHGLLDGAPGADMALVAHSGVNGALFRALTGRDPACSWPYGGVAQLLLDEKGAVAYRVAASPADLPAPVPDEDTCLALMRDCGAPRRVIDHGRAVADKALALCRALEGRGVRLRERLVFAGALLHDMEKGSPHHAMAAACRLTELGYAAVGAVVGSHMRLEKEDEGRWSEKSVVFLADKLVRETSPVTLEERFFGGVTPEKLPYARERYDQAKVLFTMLKKDG